MTCWCARGPRGDGPRRGTGKIVMDHKICHKLVRLPPTAHHHHQPVFATSLGAAPHQHSLDQTFHCRNQYEDLSCFHLPRACRSLFGIECLCAGPHNVVVQVDIPVRQVQQHG